MKKWRLVYLAIPLTVLVFAGIAMKNGRTAGEEPAEGIGRVPTVRRYAASVQEEEIPALPAYDEYVEGESPVPVWWDPDEPMAVEWEASCQQVKESNKEAVSEENVITELATQQVTHGNEIQRTDAGCPDWNYDTTLYGWDGHTAEPWEMDLFSRIVYLEFWGCSPECCEAGADSILQLWDSGYFGDTLGGVLSARAENGALVYTTYGFVWDAEYDPDGLADMRALCEERFYCGPEWDAAFFQLGGFPEWACPMYALDGVYFSTGWGWQ